eukprot:gene25702-1724_t
MEAIREDQQRFILKPNEVEQNQDERDMSIGVLTDPSLASVEQSTDIEYVLMKSCRREGSGQELPPGNSAEISSSTKEENDTEVNGSSSESTVSSNDTISTRHAKSVRTVATDPDMMDLVVPAHEVVVAEGVAHKQGLDNSSASSLSSGSSTAHTASLNSHPSLTSSDEKEILPAGITMPAEILTDLCVRRDASQNDALVLLHKSNPASGFSSRDDPDIHAKGLGCVRVYALKSAGWAYAECEQISVSPLKEKRISSDQMDRYAHGLANGAIGDLGVLDKALARRPVLPPISHLLFGSGVHKPQNHSSTVPQNLKPQNTSIIYILLYYRFSIQRETDSSLLNQLSLIITSLITLLTQTTTYPLRSNTLPKTHLLFEPRSEGVRSGGAPGLRASAYSSTPRSPIASATVSVCVSIHLIAAYALFSQGETDICSHLEHNSYTRKSFAAPQVGDRDFDSGSDVSMPGLLLPETNEAVQAQEAPPNLMLPAVQFDLDYNVLPQ